MGPGCFFIVWLNILPRLFLCSLDRYQCCRAVYLALPCRTIRSGQGHIDKAAKGVRPVDTAFYGPRVNRQGLYIPHSVQDHH